MLSLKTMEFDIFSTVRLFATLIFISSHRIDIDIHPLCLPGSAGHCRWPFTIFAFCVSTATNDTLRLRATGSQA